MRAVKIYIYFFRNVMNTLTVLLSLCWTSFIVCFVNSYKSYDLKSHVVSKDRSSFV
jgi:hypothetical protein